jgi:hypothetical protein
VERGDLAELHYLTPIVNVPSILEHGILSHQSAQDIEHQSVAMEEIQDRRARVVVPGGRRLHDYVNLYFHARNPMLYKLLAYRSSLCVLRVSADVLDLPEVVVADKNASSDYVRFAAAPDGLSIVDKELTFAEDWTHPDPIQGFRRKSARCAEVLVPHRVAPEHVQGAYVAHEAARQEMETRAPMIPVTVNRHLFFLARA